MIFYFFSKSFWDMEFFWRTTGAILAVFCSFLLHKLSFSSYESSKAVLRIGLIDNQSTMFWSLYNRWAFSIAEHLRVAQLGFL